MDNKAMSFRRILLLINVLVCMAQGIYAQDTEFWFGAPDDSYIHGGCDRPIFLMITTTNQPATVQIFIGPTLRRTVNIPANSFHKKDFTSTSDNTKIPVKSRNAVPRYRRTAWYY